MKRKISIFFVIFCYLFIVTYASSQSWRRGKITFVCEKDDTAYIMNADGSDITMLIESAHHAGGAYSLSPDGNKVAFTSGVRKNGAIESPGVIYILDLASKKMEKISRLDELNPVRSLATPRWSPDGRKIVCFAWNWGNSRCEIYIMDADGTDRQKILDLTVIFSPDWSPDGSRIAFFGRKLEPVWSIYTVDIDGGNLTNVSKNKVDLGNSGGLRYPILRWSPDGTRIVFEDVKEDIYIINSDGRNLKKLTTSDASDISPCWSPDGRKIAFSSNRDGAFHIYVMNPDGTDQKRLTDNEIEESYGVDWRIPGFKFDLEPILLKKALWGKIKSGL